MDFEGDIRLSDSPLVDMIWQVRNEDAGKFTSIAASNWEFVFTKMMGQVTFSVRGPEDKASSAEIPPEAEFLGISFKLGVYMPQLPTLQRVNNDIHLELGTSNTFCLAGSNWQIPTYENAETFINRLIQQDILLYDPLVDSTLNDQPAELSLRTVQRRILYATGLTQGAIRQIQRAHHAMSLLKSGFSILDTVFEAGYADQPHLTRSLKHYVGRTPAQLSQE